MLLLSTFVFAVENPFRNFFDDDNSSTLISGNILRGQIPESVIGFLKDLFTNDQKEDEKINATIENRSALRVHGNLKIEEMKEFRLQGKQRLSSKKEFTLTTSVIAARASGIGSADIVLPVEGAVNSIVHCSLWNFNTSLCEGDWERTNIPFTTNGTHIFFSVNSFSAYGGAYLEILNPVSYLSNGDEWTVLFQTYGVADLVIYSPNASWWEFPVDNNVTFAEMQFLNISCGETLLEPLVDTGSGYTNISQLSGSTPVYGFKIPSYNCTDISRFSNLMHIAGYAELNFTYGDISAMAYDPTPACDNTISSSGLTTFDQNMSCTGTAIHVAAHNVEIDCAGFSIVYGTSGSANTYGINITRYHNISIRDCNIYEGSATGASKAGVYASNMKNLTINESYMYSIGSTSYGISANSINESRIEFTNITTRGTTGYGVYLSGSHNNTLKDMALYTSALEAVPIYLLSSASFNNITRVNATAGGRQAGIRITGHTNWISLSNITGRSINLDNAAYGLHLSNGDYNTVIGNTITSINNSGAYLENAEYNNFSQNSYWGDDGSAIEINAYNVDSWANNNFTNELAEGLPVYYNFSLQDLVVMENIDVSNIYGQIICALCTNVSYINVTIGNDGIALARTNFSRLENNTINTTKGIGLIATGANIGNIIKNNTVDTQESSLLIFYASTHNQIIGNTIASGYYGVQLTLLGSNYNNVTDNIIQTKQDKVSAYGIYLYNEAHNNFVFNNTVTTTSTASFGIYSSSRTRNNRYENNTVLVTGANNNAFRIINTEACTSTSANLVQGNSFTATGIDSHAIYMGYTVNQTHLINNNLTGTLGAIEDESGFSCDGHVFTYTNNYGTINWTDTTGFLKGMNVSGNLTFPGTVHIDRNIAALDTTEFGTNPRINSSANITLTATQPSVTQILKKELFTTSSYDVVANGTNCTSCGLISHSGGQLKFNVSSFSSFAGNGSFCGDVTSDVVMTQNEVSTGTCMNVTSSNIEVDCNGYSITYGTSGAASTFGILVQSQENVSIKNCRVTEGTSTGAGKVSVYALGSKNITINNTNTTNSGATSYGILLTSTNSSRIEQTYSTGSGSTGYVVYLYNANYNTLYNLTSRTTGLDSYGIIVTGVSGILGRYNNITLVNASTSGRAGAILIATQNNNLSHSNMTYGTGYSLVLNGDYNQIYGNTITGSTGITAAQFSNFSYNNFTGTILLLASTNNRAHHNFTNDIINGLPLYYNYSLSNMIVMQNVDVSNTYGAIMCSLCSNVSYVNVTMGTVGFNLARTSYSRIENSTINSTSPVIIYGYSTGNTIKNNTLDATSMGIYFYTTVTSNNITNNNIISISNGIHITLVNSNSNIIRDNTIYTKGNSVYGIYPYNEADWNSIINNTITTTGTSAYGVNLGLRTDNIVVENNTIITSGSSAHGLFLQTSGASCYPGNHQVNGNTILSTGASTRALYIDARAGPVHLRNNNLTGALGAAIDLGVGCGRHQLMYFNEHGVINWTNQTFIQYGLNITGNLTFPGSVFIGNNIASFNATDMGALINTSANVTLYDLTLPTMSGIIKYGHHAQSSADVIDNGIDCTDCEIVSYSGGTLHFNTTSFSSFAGNGTFCGNITTNITLTQNEVAPGTCMNVNTSNIFIDCAGYTITYATLGGSNTYGINLTGVENISVNNCSIIEGSTGGSSNHALYGLQSKNLTINNSYVLARSSSSAGVYWESVNNSRIEYTNSTGTGSSGHAVQLNPGQYNNFRNLTLRTTGSSGRSFYITNSDFNNASYLNISSAEDGISIITSDSNFISSANVTAATEAITLSSSDYNRVEGSTFNSTGLVSSPVSINSAERNNFSSNSYSNTNWAFLNFIATTDAEAHNNFTGEIVDGLPLYYNYSLKNMVILQNIDVSALYGAIVCSLCTNVSYINVTLATDGFIFARTNESRIENSTVNTTLSQTFYSAGHSKSNIIKTNTLQSQIATTMYWDNANNLYNIIQNNTILSTSIGITITQGGHRNNVTGNYIVTTGSTGYGINNYNDADYTVIVNNTVKTSGVSADGIRVSTRNSYVWVENNSVTTTAAVARGIVVSGVGGSSHNNTVKGNTINTTSSNTAYGIYLDTSASENFIINNNVTSITGAYRDASLNTNIQTFSFENTYGRINWTNSSNGGFLRNINVSGNLTFPGTAFIGDNIVTLNTSEFGSDPLINSTSDITLYNLPYVGVSQIIKLDSYTTSSSDVLTNGVACSDCNILSYASGTLTFNVTSFSSYAANGTYCGDVDQNITMTQHEIATGTCMNIIAHNIVIDCADYSITYGTSGTANSYGINNSDGYDNITLRNCNIEEGNSAGASKHGVYFLNSENSIIYNNNISMIGSSTSIYLDDRTNRTTIASNNLTSLSSYGLQILDSSSNNSIENNSIWDTVSSGYGLLLSSSMDNSVKNNYIYVVNNGLQLSNANQNLLAFNRITTFDNQRYAIALSNARLNNLSRNNLSSTNYMSLQPGFDSAFYANNTVTEDNLAEGKPILYNFSLADLTALEDISNSTYGQILCLYCTNVLYDNVTTSGDGIVIQGGNNVSVANSHVNTTGAYAIVFWLHTNGNVRNTTVEAKSGAVIGVWLTGSSTNTTITNSTIVSHGVAVTPVYVTSSQGMSVENSTLVSENYYAIVLDTNMHYARIKNNTLRTFNSDYASMFVYGSNDVVIENNTMRAESGKGIYVLAGSNRTNITNNDILAGSWEIHDITGDYTPAFLNYSNIYGEIHWSSHSGSTFGENLTIEGGIGHGRNLTISQNLVALNVSAFSDSLINSTVNITLHGLTYPGVSQIVKLEEYTTSSENILANGTECTTCTVLSYADGTVRFNASGFSSYAANGTFCGNTAQSITMSQNENVPGNCINVTASNVVIDCAGYTITYGTGGIAGTVGINVTGVENITINNCSIIEGSTTGSAKYAIQLWHGKNHTINNSYTLARSTSSISVRMENVNFSRIEYSNITALGSSASSLQLTTSHTNAFKNITLVATGSNGRGFYGLSGNFNNLTYANITSTSNLGVQFVGDNNYLAYSNVTSGSAGVTFSSSDYNRMERNTITVSALSAHALAVSSSRYSNFSNNSYFASNFDFIEYIATTDAEANNSFVDELVEGLPLYFNFSLKNIVALQNIDVRNTYGAIVCALCTNVSYFNVSIDNHGFTFARTNFSTIENSTINTTLGTAIHSDYGSQNNLIRGNIIDASVYGVYFTNAANLYNRIDGNQIVSGRSAIILSPSGVNRNNITNNNVFTKTNNAAYGINLYNDVDFNYAFNNNITTTTTSSYGIHLSTRVQNTALENNTIRTTGSTAHGILVGGVGGVSNDNVVRGNTIHTTGTATYALYIDSSGFNTTIMSNNLNGTLGALRDGSIDANSNVHSFSYENSYGLINWTNSSIGGFLRELNITSNLTFPGSVYIDHNIVALNTSSIGSHINSTANITLNSLTFASISQIIKKEQFTQSSADILANGTACTSCNILSYTGGILQFNVSGFSSYAANGSYCGNVDTNIQMTQHETVPGNCINVTASNIVIDCAGYTITYGTGGTAGMVGINASGYDNVTIKNCTLIEGISTGAAKHGISGMHGKNLTINASYVNTLGTTSYGIYLYNFTNSRVDLTNLTARGASGIALYLSNSHYNNLRNITARATATSGGQPYGFYILSSDYNNLSYLNYSVGTSLLGLGIGVYIGGDNNYMHSSNITSALGASLQVGADYNVFTGNTLTAWNDSAVYVNGAQFSNFSSNSYWTDEYDAINLFASTDNRAHHNFTNDMADGLPIYYNYSLQNMVVLENVDVSNTYGMILCSKCTNVAYNNVTMGTDGFSFARTTSSRIENSTINTTKGMAVYLPGHSSGNIVQNNTIDTLSQAILASNTNSYNTIDRNIIVAGRIALYFTLSSNYNNITNNQIWTKLRTAAYGMQIYNEGDYFRIINNSITTTTSSSYGLYLQLDEDHTLIANNTINASSHGIYMNNNGGGNSMSHNTITENTVYGIDAGAYALFLDVSVNATHISNNNLTGTLGAMAERSTSVNSQQFYYTNSHGTINWTNTSFLTEMNITANITFDENILIAENLASLDTPTFGTSPRINSSATITFSGLSYPSVTQIIKLDRHATTSADVLANGTVCTDCSILSYSGGVLQFTVPSFSSYAANGTLCGNVTEDITLVQHETAATSCLNVTANNIEIDCAGYTITYGTEGLGYGINLGSGNDTVNITNCNIIQGGTTTSSHGIYLSGATFIKVDNTNISTQSTSSVGVYAESSSTNLKFFNGNVTTTGATNAHGIQTTSSGYTHIENSSLNILGSTLDYGLYFVSSSYHNVTNNTIVVTSKTSPSYGIAFNQANVGRLLNNTIASESGEGIRIMGTSAGTGFIMVDNINDDLPILFNDSLENAKIENISIDQYSQIICAQCVNVTYTNVSIGEDGIQVPISNNITIEQSSINGTSGVPLFISNANNISIQHSYIRAGILGGAAIWMNSAVAGISIINNTIEAIGNYGLYTASLASYSNFKDNRINGSITGIYMVTDSEGSNITNNSLYVSNYCIQLDDVQHLSVSDNNCTATGSSPALYLDGADSLNVTLNSFNKTSISGYVIQLADSASENRFVNNNMTGGAGAMTDASSNSYTNYLIYNSSFGEIRWTNTSDGGFLKNLNITGNLTFPGSIIIEENIAALNTSHFGSSLINSTANITLYGIAASSIQNIVRLENFTDNRTLVLEAGTACSATTCPQISYSAGTLKFNTSSFSSFAANLSYCGDMTESVTFTKDASSSGTCINVLADNLVIDCAGFTINYSYGGTHGYGINNSAGYDNITIQHCRILEGSATTNSKYGIYFANSENNSLQRNNITTIGTSSSATYFNTVSRTQILSSIHNTTGSSANVYYETLSSGNLIANSSLISSATSGYGIQSFSSNNGIVLDNNINTTGQSASAVYLSSSTLFNISRNNFTTQHAPSLFFGGTAVNYYNHSILSDNLAEGFPILYNFSAQGTIEHIAEETYGQIICAHCSNVVYSNITLTSADGISIYNSTAILVDNTTVVSLYGEGIYAYAVRHGIFKNSQINVSADQNPGLFLIAASVNNSFINLSIFATGSNEAHAVRVWGPDYSIFENNTLQSSPSALRFHGGSIGNNISHNNITALLYNGAAISFEDASNNAILINNTFTSSNIAGSTTVWISGSSYIHASYNRMRNLEAGSAMALTGSSGNNTFHNNNFTTPVSPTIVDNTRNIFANYLMYNNSHGHIEWVNDSDGGFVRNMNVSGNLTFPGNIIIAPNLVAFNTTHFGSSPLINSTANITLYNVQAPSIENIVRLENFTDNRTLVLEAGAACSATTCPQISYEPLIGRIKFNTTGFSTFTLNESFCGDVNTSITFTKDSSSTGTCINVRAHGITIDCAGYRVNYSTAAIHGYGINNSDGYDNITIKNCNVWEGSPTTNSKSAIFSYGMTDSFINNTNITTKGTLATGIHMVVNAVRNNVSNTRITTSGLNAYGIYLSDADLLNFSYNIINTTATTAYGIYSYFSTFNLTGNEFNTTNTHSLFFDVATSDYAQTFISEDNLAEGKPILYNHSVSHAVTLENQQLHDTYGMIICANCNNVTYRNISMSRDGFSFLHGGNITLDNSTVNVSAGWSVYVSQSENFSAKNNHVNTSTNGYAMGFYIGANNAMLENNTIDLTDGGYAIALISSSSNGTVRNNTIVTAGSGAYGVYLTTNPRDNIIDDNYITTSGTGSYGIILGEGGFKNHFTNNRIITPSSIGIYLLTSADRTNISNNNITTSSGSAYGISVTGGGNTTFFNNSIMTSSRAISMSTNILNNEFGYGNEYGRITWTNLSAGGFLRNINVSYNITFPGNIHITNNTIALNTTSFGNAPLINSTSNISILSHLPFVRYIFTVDNFSTNASAIQLYGTNCTYCQYIGWNGNTFVFNATHFSSFSLHDNFIPTHDTPILNSSFGTNLTSENLTIYLQNISDRDADPIKNITNWYVNDRPLTLLHLPFEGGSTNGTLAPSNGTTKDYSGNDYTAVVVGNSTNNGGANWTHNSGYDGFGSYEFDGIEDFILIPNFYGPLNNESRTVSARVKTTYVGQVLQENFYFSYGTTGPDGNRYSLGVFAGDVIVRTSGSSVVRFNTNINDGNWHHVVVVMNGTLLSDHIAFVDGTRYDWFSSNNPEGTLQTEQGNAYIGAEVGFGVLTHFNGSIDEVQLFNRSLSYEQILAIFENKSEQIMRNETRKTEIWKACVTPTDRYTNGTTLCSSNVTILNSAPNQTTPILNSTNTTNNTFANLTLYYENVVDDDLDNVTNITSWFIDGKQLMILHMPFDGWGTNSTAHNESNSTVDYGGNSLNGTITGASWYGKGGRDGKGAYLFDGIDDYILVKLNESLNSSAESGLTISAWVKTSNVSQTLGMIFDNKAAGTNEPGYNLQIFNTGRAQFRVGNGSDQRSAVGTRNLLDGQWHFIVGVVDRANDRIRIIVDGVQEGINTLPEGYNLKFRNQAVIGKLPSSALTAFNGTIDQLIVFNRSLSIEQIRLLNASRYDIIIHNETQREEIWQACVTPNDGVVDGSRLCSNEVIIRNIAPTHDTPILNSTLGLNSTEENLTIYPQNIQDEEGDLVKNLTLWRLDENPFSTLYLPFDGGSNSTYTRDYAYSANLARPFDLNASNTDANSSPIWNRTGGYDGFGAYRFDGIDDYMDVNDTGALSNFTISYWFRRNHNGAALEVITRGGAANTYSGLSSGDLVLISYQNSSGGQQTCYSSTGYTDTNWHHVAITTGNTSPLIIYVDGVNVTSNTCGHPFSSGGVANTVSLINYLGMYTLSTQASGFNGTMDEVRVYNRILSYEQIRALYHNKTDTLVANETDNNEIWQACVTPNDGYGDGETKCSNNLTVDNIAPTAPVLISPNNGNNTLVDRNVTFTWNASTDENGDAITYWLNITLRTCGVPLGCSVLTHNIVTNNTQNVSIDLDVDSVYDWNVTATDGTDWTTSADTFNFTIPSAVYVELINDTVAFGLMDLLESENTTDDAPFPFVVENLGNVQGNITIHASDPLWDSSNALLNRSSFQFQAGNYSLENGSFDWAQSQTTWHNISNASEPRLVIAYLNYSHYNDTGEIDILATVPFDEPAGNKTSTIVITGAIA